MLPRSHRNAQRHAVDDALAGAGRLHELDKRLEAVQGAPNLGRDEGGGAGLGDLERVAFVDAAVQRRVLVLHEDVQLRQRRPLRARRLGPLFAQRGGGREEQLQRAPKRLIQHVRVVARRHKHEVVAACIP